MSGDSLLLYRGVASFVQENSSVAEPVIKAAGTAAAEKEIVKPEAPGTKESLLQQQKVEAEAEPRRKQHELISQQQKASMHANSTGMADAIGVESTSLSQQHQVSTQRRTYLEQVHRLMAVSDSQIDPFKLLQDVILPEPLIWSEFVQSFIFRDPEKLKEMLAGYPCKHIILRCTQKSNYRRSCGFMMNLFCSFFVFLLFFCTCCGEHFPTL